MAVTNERFTIPERVRSEAATRAFDGRGCYILIDGIRHRKATKAAKYIAGKYGCTTVDAMHAIMAGFAPDDDTP